MGAEEGDRGIESGINRERWGEWGGLGTSENEGLDDLEFKIHNPMHERTSPAHSLMETEDKTQAAPSFARQEDEGGVKRPNEANWAKW
jgi:hypothetical protein